MEADITARSTPCEESPGGTCISVTQLRPREVVIFSTFSLVHAFPKASDGGLYQKIAHRVTPDDPHELAPQLLGLIL